MINVTIMLIVWHKWKRCTGSLKVADLATSMETKQVCQKKRKKNPHRYLRENIRSQFLLNMTIGGQILAKKVKAFFLY